MEFLEGYEVGYAVEVDDDGDPLSQTQVVLYRTDLLWAAVTAHHFTESDNDSEADEEEREAHRQVVDYVIHRMYDFLDMNAILYPEYETDSEEE